MTLSSATHAKDTIQGRSAQGVYHAGPGGGPVGVDEGTAVGRGPGGRLEHSGPLLPSPGLKDWDANRLAPELGSRGGASLSLDGRPLGGRGASSLGRGISPLRLTGGQKTVFKAELGLQAHFLAPAKPSRVDVELPGNAPATVEGVQLSLDWLSVTFRPTPDNLLDVAQVQLAASLAMGCESGDWVELEHGTHGYQLAMLGPGGARLESGAPGRDDFHLSMPGKACQVAGGERMQGLLRYVVAHQGRPTRLDLAMDDYQRTVSPAAFQGAVQGPDVVTHAKRWRGIVGGTVGEGSQPTGATCYLGAPASRVQLRVYDKGLESQGERDCIRHELQLRDEPAQAVLQELAGGRAWGRVFASHLVRFVDFRARDSHSEVEKRVRVPWFAELVGMAQKALAYLPAPVRTIEQVIDWLERGVAPSLALAVAYFKGDMGELVGIVNRGRDRWRPRHQAMLAAA